jgi:hypothetical protein
MGRFRSPPALVWCRDDATDLDCGKGSANWEGGEDERGGVEEDEVGGMAGRCLFGLMEEESRRASGGEEEV